MTSRPEILELVYQGKLDEIINHLPDLSWAARGACVGEDSSLFFSSTPEKIGRAKEFCGSCPVSAACLQSALQGRESGIWGGTTEPERQVRFGIKPREALILKANATGVLNELLTSDANHLSQKYDVETRTIFRWKRKVQSDPIALSYAVTGRRF